MWNHASDTADAGHPSHIVVFRSAGEGNAAVLTATLNLEPSAQASPSAGIRLLCTRIGQRPMAKLYCRLGAAAVVLDEVAARSLAQSSAVAGVFPNRRRTIPTPVAPVETPRPDAAMSRDLTWALQAVGVERGDERLSGRGIKLAVLDTGIDLMHPDFEGRVDEGTTAVSFVPGQRVQDGHGHGTHCCGLAAGPRQPVEGPRYGLAHGAQLLVGKVLDDTGAGWDDIILDGMEWAVDQGARLISMSLGSPRQLNEPANPIYENIARVLIDDPNGVLVIAAAGNESRRTAAHLCPVAHPAAAPSIMAVGAIGPDLQVTDFSCAELDAIGELDVCAPGADVRSAWPGGGYRNASGTSMATPLVAGAAALWLESSPELTPRLLWERLIAGVQRLEPRRDYGYGLVQVP